MFNAKFVILKSNYKRDMNVEEFREICLSMKGATEKAPFSKDRYAGLVVYCVCDKWFALLDTDDCEYCNLKCDPDVSVDLRDRYNGITPGWHMNKRHWISVYFDSDVPNSVFKNLIETSYGLVLHSLSKKKQEEINKG